MEEFKHNVQINSQTISGFQSDFYKLICQSGEDDQRESFEKLFGFVLAKIGDSIRNKSLPVYVQLIYFPTWVYETSLNKFPKYQFYLSKNAALLYRDLIRLSLKGIMEASKQEEERKLIRGFIYHTYYAFLVLISKSLLHKQSKDIEFLIKEFYKIHEGVDRIPYQDWYRIHDLRKNKETLHESITLEVQAEKDNYSQILFYHSSLIVQSWLWYLYDRNEINAVELELYTNKLDLRYDHIEDVINDATLIYDKSGYGYFGLGGFKYKEPEEEDGFIETPPQPWDWITLGLILYLLKTNQTLNTNLDLIKNEKLIYGMFDLVNSKLIQIERDYDKWNKIIASPSPEAFKERSGFILNIFGQIRRKYLSYRESEIAKSKISPELKEKFINSVYKVWRNSSRVKNIFGYFNSLNRTSNPLVTYQPYQVSWFIKNGKEFFTPSNNLNIIGLENMGGELGVKLDRGFYNTILQPQNRKYYPSVVQALDDFIKGLKSDNIIPDLIIMSYELTGSDELNKSSKYTSRWKLTESINIPDNSGIYDGIPISFTNNAVMKGKLMVCSFKEAFAFEICNSDDFVEKELSVNLEEVTDESAWKRYSEDKQAWQIDNDGNKLTEEEAINRIKASIGVTLEVRANISIKNARAYLIADFKKEQSDVSSPKSFAKRIEVNWINKPNENKPLLES